MKNIQIFFGFAIVIVTFTSCMGSNRDSEHVERLLQDIATNVTGKLRPEISELPTQQERSYTLFRDQFRDEYLEIDKFLKANPELTEKTRDLVKELREASKQVYMYYDEFVKEKRFNLTEEESAKGMTLMKKAIAKLSEVADIAP